MIFHSLILSNFRNIGLSFSYGLRNLTSSFNNFTIQTFAYGSIVPYSPLKYKVLFSNFGSVTFNNCSTISSDRSLVLYKRTMEANSSDNNRENCSSRQTVSPKKMQRNIKVTGEKNSLVSKPKKKRVITQPISNDIPLSSYSLIIFDLETTGLDYSCEILQIAAVCGNCSFNVYVKPVYSISESASDVHHLTYIEGQLYYENEVVESVALEDGIRQFITWVGEMPFEAVMVGHNIKTFDCPRLIRALIQCNMLTEFSRITCGFINTLPLFRQLFPELHNHRQETVVRYLTGLKYKCHNALEDVNALQKALYSCEISDSIMLHHSFTLSSYMEVYSSKNSYI